MLTVQHLEEMTPGKIFARGWASDDECGINMTRSRKCLRWLAKRGEGAPDWAIYCHWADPSKHASLCGDVVDPLNQDEIDLWIERHGDKVHSKYNIQKCVPCNDEALARYRP